MERAEEIVKVTRNFQVTIPSLVRARADIKEGSFVRIFYDEAEKVIKIVPLKRKRLTLRLGRDVSVEEMEKAVGDVLDEATS
ncbi:MAG: AbrB/MazE/SpoVT family DNA-binding domain-containing protein [Candidatus Caldarchaeum sp.]|nr:AbrB/MazE/SpoVT family DNA-binding domain-containing protein [Candidatus Caldarchaeum sp.]